MKCTKCSKECVGFPTGDPKEDMCSDCAFPSLNRASDNAAEAVEIEYWRRTGEFKTCGAIFRGILGM